MEECMKRIISLALLALGMHAYMHAQEAEITSERIGIIREWKITNNDSFEPARMLPHSPHCSPAGHKYTWATVAEVAGTDQLILYIACDNRYCADINCHQTMLVTLSDVYDEETLQNKPHAQVEHAWMPDTGVASLRWCVTQAKYQCSHMRIFRELAPDNTDADRISYFMPSTLGKEADPAVVQAALDRFSERYKNLCTIIRNSEEEASKAAMLLMLVAAAVAQWRNI
jgi:hypothetical protein